MFDHYSVAVFTTAERCDLFRAALGDEVHYLLDPYDSVPLDTVLENLHAGGACIAVLDEPHFFSIEHMREGLRAYLDKPENADRLLRIVIVCPDRMAGDGQLGYFVAYLGVYDIVHGVQGTQTAAEVARVLRQPNKRSDVLDLYCGADALFELEAGGGERLPQGRSAVPVQVEMPMRGADGNGFTLQFSVQVLPFGQ